MTIALLFSRKVIINYFLYFHYYNHQYKKISFCEIVTRKNKTKKKVRKIKERKRQELKLEKEKTNHFYLI